MNSFLSQTLSDLEDKGLKRALRTVEGPQGREIIIDGKPVLNFCSNNYLGLADDPRLKEAAIECMQREGFGSGASRLVCGNMSAHAELEKRIMEFKGTEAALLFNSGYTANVGIISSLFGRGDIIFSDRLNHASIIDGILLSQAELKRYPHCDIQALEELLKDSSGYQRKGIITDSVFSMDGDIAPLPEIVALAQKYGAMVMVDEAHAFGILGKKGKGAVEHFGLEGKINIQMGTFSKAAGSFGAYVCGSQELISFLINRARSFIYTTGLPASVAAASLKAVEIIAGEASLRERLWENTRYLLKGLKDSGFDTLQTQTPIIPLVVKEAPLALEFSKRLFAQGIFISAIRPPTVPPNTARLRLTVMATHRREDLDYTLEQLQKIAKELCLL
ncbi:MAG: 8-amino-7-oxononanoate synthase [Omnitrophica WOR_2 bacterium RIFCSPHIGHO2_01_FULL_48_9]|nr:MAG: 8-amino-7-oxononanoate synthase [Omnitrophica WOR_2 bacterium RIFCSPHIGHO2_02_FULL_48_11]OGX30003.1 MAG: 8-amino-7-oxononanoate synthase [Omnitrophica WOR_2 bacterium RIFCSPHIGHO2_01_FULL_48_9]